MGEGEAAVGAGDEEAEGEQAEEDGVGGEDRDVAPQALPVQLRGPG